MTFRKAALSILLILAVSVFTVAGCGGGGDDTSPTSPGSTSTPQEVSRPNLSGRWSVSIVYTDGFQEVWVFNLTQDGDSLTGTSAEVGEPEVVPVSGTISGESVTITENWPDGFRYRYSGTIRSNSRMDGDCAGTDGSDPGSWTARKE